MMISERMTAKIFNNDICSLPHTTNNNNEDEDDDDDDWQRSTKVVRISNVKEVNGDQQYLERLEEHCARFTSPRRQWKMHRCRAVDASTLDVCFSLRCCYGEDEYILACLQDALSGGNSNLDMEVLVESPGYLPLMDKKYTHEDLLLEKDNNEHNLKRFDDLGLLVCNTRVDSHSLKCIQDMAYRFVEQVEDYFQQNHPDIDYQNGNFLFQEIGSRSGLRYDVRIDMTKNDQCSVLRHVAEQTAPWLNLVQSIFGKGNWKVEASLIYSKPGAQNQVWHCDGGHLDEEADCDGHGHAPPYGLCVFLPLIDLNPRVGFTQFFLGSHKTSQLVGFGPAAKWLAADFDGILAAGESVIYDYRLMHRGMANQEKLRPIIQLLYTKPFYVETKNYGSKSMYNK